MNYKFDSIRGKLRLGVIIGPNTNTFASKSVTFNITDDVITFGKQILVGRSEALTDFTPSYPGRPSLFAFSNQGDTFFLRNTAGIGTIFVDIFSRNYDFKYKGRGIISLNDDKKLTNTQGFRAPYKGSGTFVVSGIGGQAFAPTAYIGTGLIDVYGDSPTRKISVYGYYGDDGEFETSGTISLDQQTLLTKERKTKSYSGSGQLFSTITSRSKLSYGYTGSGNISISGTASQSTSIITANKTILFEFSSISSSKTSAVVIGDVATYNIQINSLVKRVFDQSSIGKISISGTSESVIIKNNISKLGLLRFVRHDVDNIYDTCDNEDITSDNKNSATYKFSFNPVENSAILNFTGISNTQVISVYSYTGRNTYQLLGSYSGLKFSSSNVGVGTFVTLSSYSQVNTRRYNGLQEPLVIFGSSNSSLTKYPTPSTVTYNLFGSGLTKTELKYDFDTGGTINFNGTAVSKSTHSEGGFVEFNLYGQLNYQNVRFIPASRTGGFINISGHSEKSISKSYSKTFGTLFTTSSGFESFSRPSYVGIGSMYIQEISNVTVNNKYQIPRTYVSII